MAQAQVQTLADVLKGQSDATGVICAGGGPIFTRGDLQQKINYVASLLRNSGIKPGDTVSIAKANTVSLPRNACCQLGLDEECVSCCAKVESSVSPNMSQLKFALSACMLATCPV